MSSDGQSVGSGFGVGVGVGSGGAVGVGVGVANMSKELLATWEYFTSAPVVRGKQLTSRHRNRASEPYSFMFFM